MDTTLFTPMRIRGVTLKNRIVLSPDAHLFRGEGTSGAAGDDPGGHRRDRGRLGQGDGPGRPSTWQTGMNAIAESAA